MTTHFCWHYHEKLPLNQRKTWKKTSRGFDFSAMKGTVAGEHNGAHYYTIGQRKGLNIGGKAKPLFRTRHRCKRKHSIRGTGA
jgi:tRNA U34 2-thiouridine synthase MnmA/TrmU